ncbi:MAG: DEAD/DEAH box helicase [bacterium]|nr:DEAD/DEAH box helicase [bacterium]
MLPSVLTTQLRRGIEDYLRSTFQISTPLFHGIVDRLLNEEHGVFQGPYLTMALPFLQSTLERDYFEALEMPYTPYLHQEHAFKRLSEPAPQSTIVATGTGSGKTECFLYPMLDACYRHRNEQGIKALVVYPMNALATDQAKRFARTVAGSAKLRGNVTVGLYVGQKSDAGRKASRVMSDEWAIDDRDTLRKMPPDILLTNYKMLDYMLLRFRDAMLWKLNGPETLRYVVVDEMHTFDGAQGTDLACLLRRLKFRLKTPQRHLCCVGTSATLGGGESAAKLIHYAGEVFGEAFSDDSIISESRKSVGEFLGDSVIEQLDPPGPEQIERLNPEHYADPQEFLAAQYELWFGEIPPGPPLEKGGETPPLSSQERGPGGEVSWRVKLCGKLKSHLLFQNLMRILGGRVQSYNDILDGLKKVVRSLSEIPSTDRSANFSLPNQQAEACTPELERYPLLLLNSLLALVSVALDSDSDGRSANFSLQEGQAKARTPDSQAEARTPDSQAEACTPDSQAEACTPVLRPFLDLRLQLWTRELTRMVCECASEEPTLYFSDDLKEEQLQRCLPLMNCRDCGATGWLGMLRDGDDQVQHALQDIYRSYFSGRTDSALLFPYDGKDPKGLGEGMLQRLCGDCLHVMDANHGDKCPHCGSQNLIRVFRPNTRKKVKGKVVNEAVCPFCKSTNSLSILGARAAGISSVAVSQIFASHYNDDKKALAFSDSVQDASHRAGFFGARTYRFNLRGALQKYIDAEGKGKMLPELSAGFSRYWRERLGPERYLATFIAPNMTWLEEFEAFAESGTLPPNSRLPKLVDDRVDWEIWTEYGFNARIGRTLEKSGCSTACVSPERLQEATDGLLEQLRNEIGDLRTLAPEDLLRLIYGLLLRLKNRGGIFHPMLRLYVEENGNNIFVLGQRRGQNLFMPYFGRSSRTPCFLSTRSSSRFDLSVSPDAQKTTWHQAWAEKQLQRYSVFIRTVVGDIYRFVLAALTKAGILEQRTSKDATIWGIRPEALTISADVLLLRCSECGDRLSVAAQDAAIPQGMACLRMNCRGQYVRDTVRRDYYASLYRRGDIRRIFAEEHTGLLLHNDRERIEKEFINPAGKPCAPNLLSCTPTLEMGINIGDLSSAVLCSVPPKQASYLQRIGRVGRRDGNGMSVTVAGGRPHDLYFFAEPTEMLAGEVTPPGVYLSAPAVLQRQLTAFCFDTWIAGRTVGDPMPMRLKAILDGVESHTSEQFPFSFMTFVETRHSELFEHFTGLFSGKLNDHELRLLREFFEGGEGTEGSMLYRLMNELTFLVEQRKGFRKRIRTLRSKLKTLRENPARDRHSEQQEQDLLCERDALNALVKAMNDRENYGWLADEGLLPNYAFPESGVTLRSVIYRRKKEADSEGRAYDTWSYDFERPAASAIRELAPANSFYAAHRKVEIDQVDLTLSEIEEWRFCNNCSCMQNIIGPEQHRSCPQCGSPFWSDAGQKRRLIKLKQVFATTEDASSRIGDDSEERTPVFYNQQLLVNVEEQHITRAYRIDDRMLPFGFEFLKKAVLREINFGKVGSGGDSLTIAGVEMERGGFLLCKHCGKIQKDPKNEKNAERNHTFSCPSRNQNAPENLEELLYLYREYSSEAIRILLPTTTFAQSDALLHSFIAALQLGLKEQFGGSVEHLRSCLHEEPLPDSEYRKRYLVLYDMVPGGTGYLQQLMMSHERMLEVLEKALQVMEQCECRLEPEKDGCYRCLYAYRNSFDMRSISRNTAVELLTEILKHRERFVEIDTLKQVDMNALFDSELEARFLEALRRRHTGERPVVLKKEMVNRRPGYFLKIGDMPWYIEPQVLLHERDGVALPVSVDFLFRPARESAEQPILPIAVFTDGFLYHQERIGLDSAQRMALLQSGRFRVWSFSWKDIEAQFSKKSGWFEEYLSQDLRNDATKRKRYFRHYVGGESPASGDLQKAHTHNSFDWFAAFLANPDTRAWSRYAFINGLLFGQTTEDAAVAELLSRLPESFREELCVEPQTQLVGYSSAQNDKVEILASTLKTAVQPGEIEQMSLIAILDDRSPAVKGFEKQWNGFLRLTNLFQFLPNGIFLSRSGCEQERYDFLTLRGGSPSAAQAYADDPAWRDALELACDEAQPLLTELRGRGIPAPQAGFELTKQDGEVIATAELAWEDKQLAFLLLEELEGQSIFTDKGWQTESLENTEACLELIT